MKLIVVTTPTFFVEEDKIITALFEEGLDVLHLRKPETPAMYSERLLTLIPDKYHRRIVTHEHFYLKEEFNLMGIHLNARNPKEPHDYYGHISCSCHSVEEVKNRKHFYDYVFMSPIYDSISKVNYSSTYTAEELREAQRAKIIDSKVMALGGIISGQGDIAIDKVAGGFGKQQKNNEGGQQQHRQRLQQAPQDEIFHDGLTSAAG